MENQKEIENCLNVIHAKSVEKVMLEGFLSGFNLQLRRIENEMQAHQQKICALTGKIPADLRYTMAWENVKDQSQPEPEPEVLSGQPDES